MREQKSENNLEEKLAHIFWERQSKPSTNQPKISERFQFIGIRPYPTGHPDDWGKRIEFVFFDIEQSRKDGSPQFSILFDIESSIEDCIDNGIIPDEYEKAQLLSEMFKSDQSVQVKRQKDWENLTGLYAVSPQSEDDALEGP